MIKRLKEAQRTHDFFDGHAASFRKKRRVDTDKERHGSTAVTQKFTRKHWDKDVLEDGRVSSVRR